MVRVLLLKIGIETYGIFYIMVEGGGGATSLDKSVFLRTHQVLNTVTA